MKYRGHEIVTAEQNLFYQEIESLDQSISSLVPNIWVGAEPTFTLRTSEAPEWLSEPLGGEKRRIARTLVAALRERHPGALVLRTLGRQYAGEQQARWSIGIYASRNRQPLWQGPPDPLNEAVEQCDAHRLERFHEALIVNLSALGWQVKGVRVDDELPLRVLFRLDRVAMSGAEAPDQRWLRPSVHQQTIPLTGLIDDLAAEGVFLLCIGLRQTGKDVSCVTIELPAFPDVDLFSSFLQALQAAASGLPALILQGFPPPIDNRVAWTTVTPDPAVIEVNQAPYPSSAEFLEASRELYAIATEGGLSPYRLQYNGTVSDSGGGGQFTLGGATPQSSPFLCVPKLLPRLIRYVIRHPSLSYWFGPDYLGSSSQSPRADEGIRELFRELYLAMAQMEWRETPDPEFIWRSLAPFLTDPSGNSHRADLNIEKLWNPYLPGRGRLGLVEFRAFRMASTPQRAAAISALLRGVVAMLTAKDVTPRLIDWGDTLHDRFALPYYLQQDLLSVFSDLDEANLSFGTALQQELLFDPHHHVWQVTFEGCQLEIQRALEFWPLVGDVASQERDGSRLVDASTIRRQVLLRPTSEQKVRFDGWRLSMEGTQIPLRSERDSADEVRLCGVRTREFEPWAGLHPELQPRMPLHLTLSHPELPEALQLRIHAWQPDALPYAGLPGDLEEARRRREERLTYATIPITSVAELAAPPDMCLTDYTMDLRWLTK